LRDLDWRPALPMPEPRFLVPAALACLTLFGAGLALGSVAGGPHAAPVTDLRTIMVTRTVQHTAVQRPARPAADPVSRGRAASTLERTVQVAVPVEVPVVQTRTQTVRATTTVQLPPVTSTVTATITTGTTFP
jgi:hypothetical protein